MKDGLLRKANYDFNNAVVELEALHAYYTQTRDSMIKSEVEYNSKYKISLEIAFIRTVRMDRA